VTVAGFRIDRVNPQHAAGFFLWGYKYVRKKNHHMECGSYTYFFGSVLDFNMRIYFL